MTALIEGNDAKTSRLQLVPYEVPFGDAGGVAVGENHRRSLARYQSAQHRPIGTADEDLFTLRFGDKLFARKRVGVPLDQSDSRPRSAPANQASRTERRRACGQTRFHRRPDLPMVFTRAVRF